MVSSAPRLLRVRCTTWDQVEAFYQRKLRPGGRLTIKVGFATAVGAPVTLVLELPNQIALSIDGVVTAGLGDGKAVEVTLRGLTTALVERLQSLVADARRGARDPEAQDDEARLLSARRTELARLRRLPAHEVLGVPRDPSAPELRSAWLALAHREHPDAVARYASPALSAAATEVMALATAAFARVRAAAVAEGRANATGASVRARTELPPVPPLDDELPPAIVDDSSGPLLAEEPVAPAEPPRQDEPAAPGPMPRLVEIPESDDADAPVTVAIEPEATRPATLLPLDAMLSGPHAPPALGAPVPRSSAVMPAITAEALTGNRAVAGDRFTRQVREHLARGDHAAASQLAEAAIQLYPDDRGLRALAAVAAAMAACARGDRVAAVGALEVAIAADPSCGEAATSLAELRHVAVPTVALIRRWFE